MLHLEKLNNRNVKEKEETVSIVKQKWRTTKVGEKMDCKRKSKNENVRYYELQPGKLKVSKESDTGGLIN
ncbi:hypothetical protein AWRI1499_0987 [Brettanomyces bruxellensis AWRI1499]|nr:hypothetical protein AWRI1499_0987 [Brettanomyces bruxellensis AWRI1499]